MNLFTSIFLAAIVLNLAVQWYLLQRNVSHVQLNRNAVPEAFRDKIPLAAHQLAADYTCDKSRTGLIESAIGVMILILWTLGGALQYLDGFWRSFQLPGIWTGVLFILSIMIISMILDIPMSLYRTFVLEQRFGSNQPLLP